jgi:glyoxylase-like metal-dependent hydrolase (beta-lactamase superfamily II)
VVASHDGQVIELNGRPLRVADTPGHARHHHCLWDERSRGWFTGDTFGLSYREFDTERGAWIMPTSTPVQFDPPALRQSVQRLLREQPDAMYLTHFGHVRDVQRLADTLLDQVDAMLILGEALRDAPERHARLKAGLLALYQDRLAAHGITDRDLVAECLAMDVELNAQGLAIWLDRPAA